MPTSAMGGLSICTGSIALATAAATVALRHKLPTVSLVVLGHAVATGAIISAASSDYLCDQTAWLLGKVRAHSLQMLDTCALL